MKSRLSGYRWKITLDAIKPCSLLNSANVIPTLAFNYNFQAEDRPSLVGRGRIHSTTGSYTAGMVLGPNAALREPITEGEACCMA